MLKIALEILALIIAFLGVQALTVWVIMRSKRKRGDGAPGA